MPRQRIDAIEIDTAIAAGSSVPSLATSIPPELFENILAHVGVEDQLYHHDILDPTSPHNASAVDARRDKMRHLSACALTCVYWAQLIRECMFRHLILRSSEDLSGLQSLLRDPQSPRLPPIHDTLQCLHVFYTLGDHPWLHNLAALAAHYHVSRLQWVNLHITGPARSTFVAASTRGSILHPLFFAAPRFLPVAFPRSCYFLLLIGNIHMPNPTVLFNLLQDCSSLRPWGIRSTNLTWDRDPVLQASTSSVGLKYACHTEPTQWNRVSGCTDDVLVAAMVESIPHHELSQRPQGPHLNPLETSCLFYVMRTTWSQSSTELERTSEVFNISSDSDFDSIQRTIAIRLPLGTDFCLKWKVDGFIFSCIAMQLPHAAAIGNDLRNITYIIIDLCNLGGPNKLRDHMKAVNIDWDAFLLAVRRLPHLRQITIQDGNSRGPSDSHWMLAGFLAHLGEVWTSLGNILELYYGVPRWIGNKFEYDSVHVRLDTLMDEIKQMKSEIKVEVESEKAALGELESSIVEQSSNHNE